MILYFIFFKLEFEGYFAIKMDNKL